MDRYRPSPLFQLGTKSIGTRSIMSIEWNHVHGFLWLPYCVCATVIISSIVRITLWLIGSPCSMHFIWFRYLLSNPDHSLSLVGPVNNMVFSICIFTLLISHRFPISPRIVHLLAVWRNRVASMPVYLLSNVWHCPALRNHWQTVKHLYQTNAQGQFRCHSLTAQNHKMLASFFAVVGGS